MNIKNISNIFPSISNLFYSQIYNDKSKSFCSFMQEIKGCPFKIEQLSLDLATKIKPFKDTIDLFVSVPKFIDEIYENDYAKTLAQTLAKELDIPYRDDIVIKSKKTKKLKMIPQEERSQEISDSFKINLNDNLKICIVDDVLSSGATLQEVIKTFEINGFENISVAVLIVQGF